MATSGTYSYNITADGLITDALRGLSVLEEGVSATTAQINDSLPACEMYLKSLSKYGLNLWTIHNEGETVPLVSGQNSYNVPVDTNKKGLKILEVVYRDSEGSDTKMIPLTREEYWNLSDKTSSGEPTQFFYDPNSQSTSKMYVWPTPDAISDDGTLRVVYQHHIEDINLAGNNIAVPTEWLETIKYGIMVRLAPMYGYPVQERSLLLREYREMLKESLDWDTEQESIYLQPADKS